MSLHVVAGRGATGSATALLLAEAGEEVRLVSRGGGGPEHPSIERIAADVTDADGLTDIVKGAATLFGCAAPAYHLWPAEFPPLHAALLTAAERTGAGYVMLGNLYGYGPGHELITEDSPLNAAGPKGRTRARMWEEALAAHEAGRVRVTEVRAGQFVGPGAASVFTLMVQPRVLAGELALVAGHVDTPHPYSSIADVARALVAVSRDERAWGRAWHAPMNEISVRDLAVRLAVLAGAPEPRVEQMSDRELALLGLTAPIWAELEETLYMSDESFRVDSTRSGRTFSLAPTPVEETLRRTLAELEARRPV
ncbi:NAD-dependent epimerase/dehydratase family protein [Sphaerisporangium fuscum]|uniref:NAD-dependent epimerase/dehydratase family protein n=1 Tax=Sphaerisporangium fuscum TaxID=2835868 RepID=UPI001BDBD6C1|nr:NAD-dependent epimerase/dehydratase family protein [Sphaerisporangium fuscum]